MVSSIKNTHTVTFHVFFATKYGEEGWVATNRDGQPHHVKYVSERTNFNLVKASMSAATLDPQDHELVVKMLNALEADGFTDIQFLQVDIQQDERLVDLNDGCYLDLRRQAALHKLTPNDIECLGLEGILVYNKLRYHAVDDSIDDVPF